MNIPKVTVPRDKKTLEFFLDRALPLHLAHVYQQLAPGETVDDFYRSVLMPMSAAQIFGDELQKRAHERGNEHGNGMYSYEIFQIACGYLAEAKVAHAKGDRRRAWSSA